MSAAAVKRELKKFADPEKAAFYPRFFKTGPGEYGEGDTFIGVVVPNIRNISKKFRDLSLSEIQKLIKDPIHEVRMCGFYILVAQYEKVDEKAQAKLAAFYLKNLKHVNNWDLVDTSAPYILGPHFFTRSRKPLYALAKSTDLWKQRVAILTTFYFIKRKDFKDTLKISEILLNHEHDLIHKAVGWMLREVGNMNLKTEEQFLKKHYKKMPRTMLRYAIEKFPEEARQAYLKGTA